PDPPQAAVARLHDLLSRGNRRCLDRAEEVRREGRRRRLQEGAGRHGPVPVRLVHAWCRAGPGGLRSVLAEGPECETHRLRSIPDETTRLAALKRGELDIAYNLRGELAQEIRRTPGLTLKPNVGQATHWVYFSEQWDPKSPWHDRRVRLAANHAIDRQSMNQADALGFAKLTFSIIPSSFEFYWQPPGHSYDRARPKQ